MTKKETEINRVVIVEDDPIILGILTSDIARMEGFQLVAATSSAKSAKRIKPSTYDILLLDLQILEGHGLDVLDFVHQSEPRPKFLILSATGDQKTVLDAIKRGADGYLLKDASPESIEKRLKDLVMGRACINNPIGAVLFESLREESVKTKSAQHKPVGLTAREHEVLKLLAKGLSYQQASDELGVSYNTTSDYIKNVYQKLNVRSRSEAVYKALNDGIINF